MNTKIVIFITLAIITYYMATDIYTPSMPTIAHEFLVHRDMVQETLTIFLIGALMSSIAAGVLADRFGKRRILLFGLFTAVIGSILATYCTTINQLLIARFLQGIGGVTSNVVGLSIVHDYTSEKKATKLFGIMGIFFAIIPAFAPIIGGYLNDHFSWRSSFYVLQALFTISFIGVFMMVPKNPSSSQNDLTPRIRLDNYLKMIKTRPFMMLILVSPLFVSGEWFMISFLPFYFQHHLDFTPELYGFFLGAFIPWYAAGSYVAGKYNEKFGIDHLIYVALFMGIFSALLLTIVALYMPTSANLIYIALSINMIGFGILFPTTTTKLLGFFSNFKATATSFRSLFSVSFAYLGAQFAEVADENQFIHLALYFCSFSIIALLLFRFRGEKALKMD